MGVIEAKTPSSSLATDFEALPDEAILGEGRLAFVLEGGEDSWLFPTDGAVAPFAGVLRNARDIFIPFVGGSVTLVLDHTGAD